MFEHTIEMLRSRRDLDFPILVGGELYHDNPALGQCRQWPGIEDCHEVGLRSFGFLLGIVGARAEEEGRYQHEEIGNEAVRRCHGVLLLRMLGNVIIDEINVDHRVCCDSIGGFLAGLLVGYKFLGQCVAQSFM